MATVAIYARYSTDLQREASIEDQIRLCEEWAAAQGLSVHQCYTDHGTSGASLRRPGIQALMADASRGRFDTIIAEAMDRLSRDQEDIAGFHKRMGFAGVRIVTLAEGEVTNLHVGLKGTMNALFLQDLAAKTRRGLRGRVEAGKSGGGNAYGYDVVRQAAADGTPLRGDRRINEAEARIVRRIFEDYATGRSPRAIAHTLNAEGVRGPSGKGWGPSTIHGNRTRGTGILNNELYVGRLVWNRLTYVKNPDTGKRISRLNAESAWVTQDVPELRLIDDALWEKVKERQGTMRASKHADNDPGYWDRRRPRYLFSGLMRCGVCGGGVINFNKTRVGCATARNKGTCSNRTSIARAELEEMVLEGLERHLMTPALTEIFCRAYTEHMNRLATEQNAGRDAARAELERVERDLDKLIEAILDGVPGARLKDKIAALEARKEALEAQLAEGDAGSAQVHLHPNMSAYYRSRIHRLRAMLTGETGKAEAVDALRALIDHIELTPHTLPDGRTTLTARLHGSLAGILSMSLEADKTLSAHNNSGCAPGSVGSVVKLVAGAGFEPATFRL
ncbi:MAG: recombinase family protein [Pseudomonadota bacterium]